MPLPNPRVSEELEVSQRPLEFSLWPVSRTTRRFGLQSNLPISDPWNIIKHSISSCSESNRRIARAFIDQALEFYQTANRSDIVATKPLLLYYSFLNLVKAFVLKKGVVSDYSIAQHGLSEKLQTNGIELIDAYLDAYPSGSRQNVFDDFLRAISNRRLPIHQQIPLVHILPQILQGHELWRDATDNQSRFIALKRISFYHDPSNKLIWLCWFLLLDDVTQLRITRAKVLCDSGLNNFFREVRCTETIEGRRLVRFEQLNPISYTGRPSDKVLEVVSVIKPFLWQEFLNIAPFRKYYVYLCPQVEHCSLFPQPLSIYALFFYLGSITRYRPYQYQQFVSGDIQAISKYGTQIQEVIRTLPEQFLYIMASEFAEREIVRASI